MPRNRATTVGEENKTARRYRGGPRTDDETEKKKRRERRGGLIGQRSSCERPKGLSRRGIQAIAKWEEKSPAHTLIIYETVDWGRPNRTTAPEEHWQEPRRSKFWA